MPRAAREIGSSEFALPLEHLAFAISEVVDGLVDRNAESLPAR